MGLSDADYARLLTLRNGLRRFLRWTEQRARVVGLTPNQHQLLLAIRGHEDPRGPTIGEVADYLLLRHHSTVELVDRADAAGLVIRERDPDDRRVVRLRLTEDAAERLDGLSGLHLEELDRLALQLPFASNGIAPVQPTHGLPGGSASVPVVTVARIYDYVPIPPTPAVLVDRLWPRGLAKTDAPFDVWLKEVAPSTELRRWYGHDPERFEAFAERYRAELAERPAREARERIEALAGSRGVVLLTATKDVDHSAAAVLGDVLTRA